MKIDLKETGFIDIFVDENNNIVIFPYSKSNVPADPQGAKIVKDEFYSFHANYPIELMQPYTKEELCNSIRFGFKQWNKHPYYYYKKEKKTLEEKYYGIKGFKNAMKNKRYLSAYYNPVKGGRINLEFPCKRGYAYLRKRWLIRRSKFASDFFECKEGI